MAIVKTIIIIITKSLITARFFGHDTRENSFPTPKNQRLNL
jgi:hypothetical protein